MPTLIIEEWENLLIVVKLIQKANTEYLYECNNDKTVAQNARPIKMKRRHF